MQMTLKSEVEFRGVGLHGGAPVTMRVAPAPAGSGIVFQRVDLPGAPCIPALWDRVTPSALCTVIEQDGASVSTIEHIMAALAGCGIVNARVMLDAPEVPILDGSAALFVRSFLAAGLAPQNAPARAIRLRAPVEIRSGAAVARLEPADRFVMSFHIDFADRAIGVQDKTLTLSNGAFLRELMDSRTFCRLADVEDMRARGLARGGDFSNAVVVDGDKVLSPGGLRHSDEAVRHKMLDAVGDLALAGAPIIGRYCGNRAGHALTNKLLRALFASPSSYEYTLCAPDDESFLLGAGISDAAYGQNLPQAAVA